LNEARLWWAVVTPEWAAGAGAVEALHAEHNALREYLLATEPSLAVSAEGSLSKALLLAGASYAEHALQLIVIDAFDNAIRSNPALVRFVEAKALKRQYHTMFNWESANANQFFGLFGSDFKVAIQREIAGDRDLAEAISGFLELGRLRNELVHQNFAAFSLPKTADEIYGLYRRAATFLERLPGLLCLLETAGSKPEASLREDTAGAAEDSGSVRPRDG